ncbi:MAG: hypothetical protein QW324_07430 [Thermofilaceae archaeon]
MEREFEYDDINEVCTPDPEYERRRGIPSCEALIGRKILEALRRIGLEVEGDFRVRFFSGLVMHFDIWAVERPGSGISLARGRGRELGIWAFDFDVYSPRDRRPLYFGDVTAELLCSKPPEKGPWTPLCKLVRIYGSVKPALSLPYENPQ